MASNVASANNPAPALTLPAWHSYHNAEIAALATFVCLGAIAFILKNYNIIPQQGLIGAVSGCGALAFVTLILMAKRHYEKTHLTDADIKFIKDQEIEIIHKEKNHKISDYDNQIERAVFAFIENQHLQDAQTPFIITFKDNDVIRGVQGNIALNNSTVEQIKTDFLYTLRSIRSDYTKVIAKKPKEQALPLLPS